MAINPVISLFVIPYSKQQHFIRIVVRGAGGLSSDVTRSPRVESHLFTTAANCFNVRTKCSEDPYWYLQFNQKTVISVPEHLRVHSLQTAVTGKGRTNKISWLNLPFMLLMSAAGILEGGSVLISALNAAMTRKMCFSLKIGHGAYQLSSQRRICMNHRYFRAVIGS